MKKLVLLSVSLLFIYACSTNNSRNSEGEEKGSAAHTSPSDYDPKRGEGKFDKVEVGEKLDEAMAREGKAVYELKCSSCHRLTEERLVGPGWAGVSEKHRPEWMLNFITNPDPMIDKDPELQAQLELCLVRMPNQNLTDQDARNVLEFMRENDGVR